MLIIIKIYYNNFNNSRPLSPLRLCDRFACAIASLVPVFYSIVKHHHRLDSSAYLNLIIVAHCLLICAPPITVGFL